MLRLNFSTSWFQDSRFVKHKSSNQREHSHAQRTPRDEGSRSDTKPQIACHDRRLSDVVNEIESGMRQVRLFMQTNGEQSMQISWIFIRAGIDFKSELNRTPAEAFCVVGSA